MLLLKMSLGGTVLALISFLLCRILKSKISSQIRIFLWEIILFRMICPFEVNIGVEKIISSDLCDIIIDYNRVWQSEKVVLRDIWFIGMSILLLYVSLKYAISVRRYGEAIPLAVSGYNCDKRLSSFRRAINVKSYDKILSPMAYGIFKPVILIPKGMSKDAVPNVIKHELVHISRYDLLRKAISFIIVSIHWMNPVAWIVFAKLLCDMEMFCDAKVLENSDNEEYIKYSSTLLSFKEKVCWGSTGIGFSDRTTVLRIEAIVGKSQGKKESVQVGRTVCCFVLLMLLVTLVNIDIRTGYRSIGMTLDQTILIDDFLGNKYQVINIERK